MTIVMLSNRKYVKKILKIGRYCYSVDFRHGEFGVEPDFIYFVFNIRKSYDIFRSKSTIAHEI